MRVFRLYTKDNGDSALDLHEIPMTGGDRPLSETFPAESVFFRDTPEGHVQTYHNAPRRQLIVLTTGIMEIETSDGERTVCQPGDIVFAEDFTGKGHITRSLRGTRGFMHLVMPDTFEVKHWPLVKKPTLKPAVK
jgi:hypothetical protein